MILTGENRTARRETCCTVTLSTTSLTQTALGSNPGFRSDRPETKRLSHGNSETKINLNYT
jgi:hypothetical protein